MVNCTDAPSASRVIRLENQYKRLEGAALLATSKGRMTAFVAGPYLDPKWLAGEVEPVGASAMLRFKIVQALKGLNVDPFLGEHQALDAVSRTHLRGSHNAATAELMALSESDAIVILPSSTGSFCEFGAWVQMPHVCRKMLILLNQEFEKSTSYINLGVAPFAKKQGAEVVHIDYLNITQAIELVTDFVLEKHAEKRVKSLINGE